jgi:hypothetical protein
MAELSQEFKNQQDEFTKQIPPSVLRPPVFISIQTLYAFLLGLDPYDDRRYKHFWLILSFTFSLSYSLVALNQTLNADYLIPDDGRQHLFWMQRFIDPDLFPGDWITDYFQSIAPPGHKAFYWFFAQLGLHPYLTAKLLPTFLGIVVTFYSFETCLALLPIPFTGFMATVLLNQNLWMQDGLSSGAARSFILPLAYAFFYYFLRSSLWGCLITIALISSIYPPLVLVISALLIVQLWDGSQGSSPSQKMLQKMRQPYQFYLWGLVVAGLVLVPQILLGDAPFGPTVSLEQAQTMPEFWPGGRNQFFNPNHPWDFWFNGSGSGLKLASGLTSPLMFSAFLLPLLAHFKGFFPLAHRLRSHVQVLGQFALVSIGLFLLAHTLLFHLYLPSRYSQHSFRLIFVLASAIALTLILEACLRRAILILERRFSFLLWRRYANGDAPRTFKAKLGAMAIVGLCLAVIIVQLFYPQLTLKTFPKLDYVSGSYPELYEFLQQQPKTIKIGSIDSEASNLPSFAARSVLISPEAGISYHWGYYQEFRQRALDLIAAQYSPSLTTFNQIVETYQIDLWLLNSAAFEPEYLDQSAWLQQFQPVVSTASQQLHHPQQHCLEPVLKSFAPRCTVFSVENLLVLDTDCLAAISQDYASDAACNR